MTIVEKLKQALKEIRAIDDLNPYPDDGEKLIKEVIGDLMPLIGFLKEGCCCSSLADPKDRSRYAGYLRHSGHCARCKQLSVLGELHP